MAASVPTVEECAQRWADGVTAELERVLASSGSHKEVARAVATLSGAIRTLTRRCGRQMNLSIPGWIRDATGWEPGTQVVLGLTERGEVMVRKATKRDLEPFADLLKLDPGPLREDVALPVAADARRRAVRVAGRRKRSAKPRRPTQPSTPARPTLAPARKARSVRSSAVPH